MSRITKEIEDKIVEMYMDGSRNVDIIKALDVTDDQVRRIVKKRGVYREKKFYGDFTYEEVQEIGQLYQENKIDELYSKYQSLNKQKVYSICSKYGFKKESYFWTREEEDFLRENYGKMSYREIAEKLNNRHTVGGVSTKAIDMKLVHPPNLWSNEENETLKTYYPILPSKELDCLLPNRTHDAIIIHAGILGLQSYVTLNERYSDEQKQFIIDNYKTMTDQELADVLGKPLSGIQEQRRKLGIYYLMKDYSKYTDLIDLFRGHIWDWKMESIKKCNYSCIFTESKDFHVHHIYGFNMIADEALRYLDNKELLRSTLISDYTIDELNIMIHMFNNIHNKYPLGVCVRTDIHNLFHSIYGHGGNTPKQWNKFYNDFKNGIYKDKIEI